MTLSSAPLVPRFHTMPTHSLYPTHLISDTYTHISTTVFCISCYTGAVHSGGATQHPNVRVHDSCWTENDRFFQRHTSHTTGVSSPQHMVVGTVGPDDSHIASLRPNDRVTSADPSLLRRRAADSAHLALLPRPQTLNHMSFSRRIIPSSHPFSTPVGGAGRVCPLSRATPQEARTNSSQRVWVCLP